MADVFTDLSKKLNELPEQIQKAYEEATIEAVDNATAKVEEYFLRNSGSKRLNAKMFNKVIAREHDYYFRYIDWADELVNPNRETVNDKPKLEGNVQVSKNGKIWHSRKKQRPTGKRNFSLHPATWHDLAYILNYGHETVNGKKVQPNYFITKGMRAIRKWKERRDSDFLRKLDEETKDLR